MLCTATKQKNNGQNLEEDLGHNEQKTDQPSTDKILLEEKVKLEEQLRETVVRTWALLGCFLYSLHKKSCFTGDKAKPEIFSHVSTACNGLS